MRNMEAVRIITKTSNTTQRSNEATGRRGNFRTLVEQVLKPTNNKVPKIKLGTCTVHSNKNIFVE